MLDLSTKYGEPPEITSPLVSHLLSSQFPHLAHLPVTPAEPQGWDNRTFRLGDAHSVRLPSAAGYVPQVEKEHRWLPFLAPHLPLPIPVPLERGEPDALYPFPWSVYPWLEGAVFSLERVLDLNGFAEDLAAFLSVLQRIDASSGPPPGLHSAYRGGPLEFYASDVDAALETLGNRVDARAA